MKKETYNGHELMVYESITELPVENFFKFNLNVALEAGIGGDVNSVMGRNKELREWIRRGRKKEALLALSNMENSIMAIMQGVNPETNAFVCLLHSIDGEPVTDLSEAGMAECLQKLSKKGMTLGFLRSILNRLKKNFSHEVDQFFPEIGNAPSMIERGAVLKQRTLAALKMIQGKATGADVKRLDDIIIEFIVPKLYWGPDGVEVRRMNGFEDAMVVIRKELNIHGAMTAHQFLKHTLTVKEIMNQRKKQARK